MKDLQMPGGSRMNEWILISQKENQLGLSWQLCKELLENRNIGQTEWMCEWSNKNYPYQLCVNFCILTLLLVSLAPILMREEQSFRNSRSITLKIKLTQSLQLYLFCKYIKLMQFCFWTAKFWWGHVDKGHLWWDPLGNQVVLPITFLFVLIAQSCSIHWQKGKNASRGLQILGCHCLDVLPHLVACPPCPLVGNGRGGQPDKTEQMPLLCSDPVSSLLSRCWAALARCEQMPNSTNKMLGLSCVWSGSEARQLSSTTSASLPPKGTFLPSPSFTGPQLKFKSLFGTDMHKQVWFSLSNFFCTFLSLHKEF